MIDRHPDTELSPRRRSGRRLSCLVLVVAAGSLITARQQSPASSPTVSVFENVSVIPMDRDRVLDGQTVVVRGDRIEQIGPAARVATPSGARKIDGRGKYLMPALAEMHAHIPGGQASDAEMERVLFLYAAHGIGTIRGMLGHPRHLALRERVRREEIVAPTIYTAGPSLNGSSVPDAATAIAAVKAQKAAGYDFLKIHPGVSRAAFDALAATAHEVSIPFAGHVPADVGLARALEARYRTIDHLDGYLEALAGPGAPESELFGLNLVSRIDEARISSVVAQTKAAGVAQVPTEALLEHWVGPDAPETMAAWPEMRFVAKAQISAWTAQKREFTQGASQADRTRFLELRRTLLRQMHAAGVPLLLGSDAPQVWNVPGASIHRELQYLVRAGLSPWAALETGTRAVGQFFGTPERGVVDAGRKADLLLLDANPLADIANTSRIAGVMLRGRWLPREDIATRLDRIAGEVNQ
jgi:imidazolonepropionase-like amidohydrolase